jgi:hypothetical protein
MTTPTDLDYDHDDLLTDEDQSDSDSDEGDIDSDLPPLSPSNSRKAFKYDFLSGEYGLDDENTEGGLPSKEDKGQGLSAYVKAKKHQQLARETKGGGKPGKGKGPSDMYILEQPLSVNHMRFCELVAKGFSAGKAYQRIYQCASSTARNAGPKLLKREDIAQYLDKLNWERAEVTSKVTPGESLSRWNEIYLAALSTGDSKLMIEAQKQIDKVNGASDGAVNGRSDANVFIMEEDNLAEVIPRLLDIIEGQSSKPKIG